VPGLGSPWSCTASSPWSSRELAGSRDGSSRRRGSRQGRHPGFNYFFNADWPRVIGDIARSHARGASSVVSNAHPPPRVRRSALAPAATLVFALSTTEVVLVRSGFSTCWLGGRRARTRRFLDALSPCVRARLCVRRRPRSEQRRVRRADALALRLTRSRGCVCPLRRDSWGARISAAFPAGEVD
jgi:hypothetical protein